ncbi:MAG TPA: hypothetical protein VEF34_14635, partial [Syntrophobacteraceae bacterium]|nr:hypothetical protein [Syntrophobacteraceae bacterium]
MRQAKVRPNHANIDFNDVAAVADRMVWTGRLPTLNAICEELNVRSTDKIEQCFALWRAGHSHNQIEVLMQALGDAEARIADRERQI